MRYIRHILFFPILTFFCGSLLSQQDSLLSRAIMVKAVFQKYHYDPAVLNDDFSAKAFILFRTMLDPRDHYFLMPDIEQLKKYENTIDEFLNGKPSDMIPVVTKLYKERLQGALRKIEEISAVPLTSLPTNRYVFTQMIRSCFLPTRKDFTGAGTNG